ncbi:hypothetical protein N7540_012729 [Penicillium herquei]|nr:hypothetical protein N7540_012729 [Penicillium herquei]
MPGESVDRSNSQPLSSYLPEYVEKLKVLLSEILLDQEACDALFEFRRAASYIADMKISSKRKLTFNEIKPRLLGT